MQIYKVGGAVRDRLLGRPVTDIDWVVVGASTEEMIAQGFKPVGADFPVFLHPRSGEEYALARTERKSGRGYGGFVFHASPDVTLEQDLIRRDLTINAMAEDAEGEVIDPYGGRADLEARVLRHVSPAFAEDPLRVLRVARFAARYAPLGFQVADDTLALMRTLAESGELEALTAERSWKEISRALMEARPDVFISTLRRCGALEKLLPEVDALLHVNGDHVLNVLQRCADEQTDLPIRWASLLRNVADLPGCNIDTIDTLNRRGKVPRDCQELSRLVGEFHGPAAAATALPPADLLDILQRFDVYRRPQRLEDFLQVEHINAQALGSNYPQTAYLRGATKAVRDVQPAALMAKGFKGAALGEALSAARLEALETFKREYTQ
ncbi:multifunctional CCA addition/repair protein [Pseudomonas matsuisoli]|uniref:CCA-adding enzyme n=1 Tax=Pseudomonas matsuisoli TaxID=1515666 RepID=A0A917PZV7_9PSED|nr:multifunctional CCA addition/repair protein [Pseudomonas matsuisoli]GGK02173.1 multifunctional CCA protein [Pseudomonas matsuisoli]